MASKVPAYRLELSRADLQLLVEAIMCATTSDRPGFAEAGQMRELALRLQRIVESPPPETFRPTELGRRRDTPVPR